MKTKEATNKVHAGVGRPINESVWRGSLLNFANRNIENTGIRNARKLSGTDSVKIFIVKMELLFIKAKTIMPGNTPKVTASARESRSLPIML